MIKINRSRRYYLSDAELIKAFQAGDKDVFDELVIRYKDRIVNLCYRFLGDYQDACDTAQDVFIKAFEALVKFRFKSSFYTWIYRISVNTCNNRLKSLEFRFKKMIKRFGNPGFSNTGNAYLSCPDESFSPAVRLEKKERSILIARAVDSLSGLKKTVVILRDIEGLAYDEISKITGLKPGTVKSKLARARADLRKKLKSVL
jgi:RNA polymerase sigma-70 factor (ECF subfamily)